MNFKRKKQEYIFAAIAAVLFSWTVYAQFFATQEALRASENFYIDAVMHFLGGFLAAGAAIYYARAPKIYALIFLASVAVAWEIFELTFVPNVRYFYENFYHDWLSDTRGDVILGIIGGLVYVVLHCRERRSSNENHEANSGLR